MILGMVMNVWGIGSVVCLIIAIVLGKLSNKKIYADNIFQALLVILFWPIVIIGFSVGLPIGYLGSKLVNWLNK